MAKLATRARNALPAGAFAGPGRTSPVPYKAHARNAESRAAQFAGPTEKAKIDRRADKVLGKSKGR